MDARELVLVTGGAGFIGSHVVERFVEAGYPVRVLDNLSSGVLKNLDAVRERIEFIEGDIRDAAMVRRAMTGVTYVTHQASLRSVPKSVEMPEEFHDVNVNGTLCLLSAAREQAIQRFVFASSSSIYGDTNQFPQRESQTCCPISPYALTKLIGEQYCRFYSQVYGVPTVALRYFNVYGPRQPLEDRYSAVIPKFLAEAMANRALPIYGDGTQSRDFTYVANVAEANLRACLAPPSVCGEVYNVALGETHSILELARAVISLLDSQSTLQFSPRRVADVSRTHADVARIRECMQFCGAIGFDEGLRRTIEYQRHSVGTSSGSIG